MVSKYHSELTD